MNVSLPKSWEDYVADQVESGRFESAAEVVADALQRQQEYLVKFEAFRREVDKGMASIDAGRIVTPPTIDELFEEARQRKHAK